jgi:hypothetical protein
MNVLTTDGWQMQWRRVERGFVKLQKEYNNTELYDDDIYHFFQDAWHLKDWIKNDSSVPKMVHDQIETEVGSKKCLRIAADFANGTKHMLLKWPRSENAQLTGRNVTIMLGASGKARHEWVLTLSDGSNTTADVVAKEVMEQWILLLRKFGLVT